MKNKVVFVLIVRYEKVRCEDVLQCFSNVIEILSSTPAVGIWKSDSVARY